MVRQTIHFTGRVQGVGFRYTTQRLARSHCVAGYVRNLDDGRVQLVAEGEPEAIQGLLEDIRRQFEGFIREVKMDTAPATGQFGSPCPGALTIH